MQSAGIEIAAVPGERGGRRGPGVIVALVGGRLAGRRQSGPSGVLSDWLAPAASLSPQQARAVTRHPYGGRLPARAFIAFAIRRGPPTRR
jgi:hypothetical protein